MRPASDRISMTAVLMTIVTTVLLGVVYPLVVTGLAQVLFRDKANGQLIERNGQVDRLAHHRAGVFVARLLPRPSVGGGHRLRRRQLGGTNLGPTNKKLIDAVTADVDAAKTENPGAARPCRRSTWSRRRRPGSTRTSLRPRRSSRCRASRASARRSEDEMRAFVDGAHGGPPVGLPRRAARQRAAAEPGGWTSGGRVSDDAELDRARSAAKSYSSAKR